MIRADLSVGMLMAVLAYKGDFVARCTNLVEQVINWRLLDLQLERLADIALTPKEQRLDQGGYEGPICGAIECRSLSFRYSFGEQPVLLNFNLAVGPGEFVAITGPSGSGKSTLIKLLTGLYTASAGTVLIDGRPLADWSPRSVRQQVSYVSQEDQLLGGSIAQNIAFFAEDIDMAFVRQCAATARILDEIEAMPMGLETLVGDMGSTLSGGQKQRILIARALYRRPKVLILDEGTAHLDLANEKAINDALAELPITRIVIAHRPETIAAAGRVIPLHPAGSMPAGAERREPLAKAA